jgi:hypothetical protein
MTDMSNGQTAIKMIAGLAIGIIAGVFAGQWIFDAVFRMLHPNTSDFWQNLVTLAVAAILTHRWRCRIWHSDWDILWSSWHSDWDILWSSFSPLPPKAAAGIGRRTMIEALHTVKIKKKPSHIFPEAFKFRSIRRT